MAPTPMQITLLIALFTSGALSAPARQFGGEHSSIAMQFSAFPTSDAAGFTPMATHPGKPTETGGWFHGGFPGGMHFPGGQGGKAQEKRQDYGTAAASSAAGVETSSAYMMPTSTLAAYPTGSGPGSGATPSPYGSPSNGYTPPTNTGSGSGPVSSGGYGSGPGGPGGAKPTGCSGGAKPTGGWGGYMQAAKNWMGKGGKPGDDHCGDHKGPHPEGPGKYGPTPEQSGTYGHGPEESGTYGQGPQETGHSHAPQETGTYGQGPKESSGTYGQGPKETHGAGAGYGTATAHGSTPTQPSGYNKRQEGFGGHFSGSGNKPSGNHWSGSTNGREGKPDFPQGSPVAQSGPQQTGHGGPPAGFTGHGGPPAGFSGHGGPPGGFHGPPQ